MEKTISEGMDLGAPISRYPAIDPIELARYNGYHKAIDDVLNVIPAHMLDLRVQIYNLAINKK